MGNKVYTKNLHINVRLEKARDILREKVNRLKKLGYIYDWQEAQLAEDYEGIDIYIQEKPSAEYKSVQVKGRESGKDFIVERIKIYRNTVGYNLEDFEITYDLGRDYKSLVAGTYKGVFNFSENKCYIISAEELLQKIKTKEQHSPVNYENYGLIYPENSNGERNSFPKFDKCKKTDIVTKYVFNSSIESYAKILLFVPKEHAALTWNLD